MSRRLHLAAYDVSEPSRLRAALRAVRDYATGGQKSAHEVFLSDDERVLLLRVMGEIIDPQTDRFMLLPLAAAIAAAGGATAGAGEPFGCCGEGSGLGGDALLAAGGGGKDTGPNAPALAAAEAATILAVYWAAVPGAWPTRSAHLSPYTFAG
jgi:CRISPR-associated protein Cas2